MKLKQSKTVNLTFISTKLNLAIILTVSLFISTQNANAASNIIYDTTYYTGPTGYTAGTQWTIHPAATLSIENGSDAYLHIQAGASLYNNNGYLNVLRGGRIYNDPGGYLSNSGLFHIFGTADGAGIVYNRGGVIENNNSVLIDNGGTFDNNGGEFQHWSQFLTNQGTYIDELGGNSQIYGKFDNTSTGTIHIGAASLMNISYSQGYTYGVLNNAGNVIVDNSGTLRNFSTVNNNSGSMNINGTFQNAAQFNNVASTIVNNTLNNSGNVINNGTIQATSGSVINNSNYMINTSKFWISSGAVFNNSGQFDSIGVNSLGNNVENSGQFNYVNGGHGAIYTTFNNNLGGQLHIGNNSSMYIVGASAYGQGILNNYANIGVDVGGVLFADGTVNNFSSGNISVAGNITSNGLISNYGNFNLTSSSINNGSVNLYNNFSNSSGGKLNIGSGISNGPQFNVYGNTNSGHGNLSNDATSTITNSGTFYVYNGGQVNNAGLINNNGQLDNYGNVTNNWIINNSGNINVHGVLEGTGNIYQSAGSTKVDGTLTQSNIYISGGELNGTGVINGNVSVTGLGSVTAGNASSPGLLTFNNALTFQGGLLNINIGDSTRGSGYGALNVGGAALGGTLVTQFIDLGSGAFNPLAGQKFNIVEAYGIGSITGDFSNFQLASLPTGLVWWHGIVNFGGGLQAYELQIQAVPEPDTYAMALMGLGLLSYISRRRKANQSI